jgi:hypothetical protein
MGKTFPEILRGSLGILIAFHLPGGDYSDFYSSISPVNGCRNMPNKLSGAIDNFSWILPLFMKKGSELRSDGCRTKS